MSRCAAVLAVALALPAALAGPLQAGEPTPWTETFTMAIRDQERTFVRYRDDAWLQVPIGELSDSGFIANKDVVFTAKLRTPPLGEDVSRVRLYGVNLPLVSAASAWAARVEGDNLYVFAKVEAAPDRSLQVRVVAAEPAPSDHAIIEARLTGIAKDDWQGRLAVANWVREQAHQSVARDAWLAAGDDLVVAVIDDAGAAASTGKDAALLEQAVGWCFNLLNDPGRAARVASVDWLTGTVAQKIERRLRSAGFALYGGKWRPLAEAMSQEFEDRFAAIDWRDAEAYYQLGRWTDTNAENLPRAKDCAWRAYQTGLRANPRHNGIRRELGLPAESGPSSTQLAKGSGNDFVDPASGVVVAIPENWKRNDVLGGNAGFVDPGSETASIMVTLIPLPSETAFDVVWLRQVEALTTRENYRESGSLEMSFSGGAGRRLSYAWREGGQERIAEMALAYNPRAKVAVRLDARFESEEAERVREQLSVLFGRMIIPNPAEPVSEPPAGGPPQSPPPGTPPSNPPPGTP